MDSRFLSAPALPTNDTSDVSPRAKAAEPSLPLLGIHVLIVDDDPDNRDALQMLLEHCGSRITTAADVPDALAKFEREVPDVLLSDIGMPGEDGYDLIRRVRARSQARGGGVPAAALTSYVAKKDRETALRSGFMMHIPKPVNPDELVLLVTELAQGCASSVDTGFDRSGEVGDCRNTSPNDHGGGEKGLHTL